MHVSTDPFSSVASAIRFADGRVFVNDIVARRVVIFDSTSPARVVTDSASVTATAYGFGAGALIPFHGDTTLVSRSAVERDARAQSRGANRARDGHATAEQSARLVRELVLHAGLRRAGRLLYFLAQALTMPVKPPPANTTTTSTVDSALIVRFDFASHAYDTVATIRMPKARQSITTSEEGRITRMSSMTADPAPVLDDWVVRQDGVLVIVRGRDFHVDWMDSDGKWSSAPKIAFEWQHLDDAQKQTLIDSAAAANKARRDSILAGQATGGIGGSAAGGARTGRGGGDADAPRAPQPPPPPIEDPKVEPNDVADYRPAFPHGATRVDWDGNLWIRTTTMVNGQPVYYVVNRRGELFDRVQIPPFRTLAGFGPGVVYMAVKDAAGVVHLEEAKIAR